MQVGTWSEPRGQRASHLSATDLRVCAELWPALGACSEMSTARPPRRAAPTTDPPLGAPRTPTGTPRTTRPLAVPPPSLKDTDEG